MNKKGIESHEIEMKWKSERERMNDEEVRMKMVGKSPTHFSHRLYNKKSSERVISS